MLVPAIKHPGFAGIRARMRAECRAVFTAVVEGRVADKARVNFARALVRTIIRRYRKRFGLNDKYVNLTRQFPQ